MPFTPNGNTRPHVRKDFNGERNRLRGLCLSATELIDALDQMHPATTPALDTTDRELWASIGARKVVELLLQLRSEAKADAGPLAL